MSLPKRHFQKFKLKPLSYMLFTCLVTTSLPTTAMRNPYLVNIFEKFPCINNPWNTKVTLNTQGGSYNYIQPDFFYPFLGDEYALNFLDARAQWTTRNSQEYNIGLGRRQLVWGGKNILGGYVYFDRAHTKQKNYFSQVSIGAEWLGPIYDFRANFYQPIGDRKRYISSNFGNQGFISGNTVSVLRFTQNQEALTGADIEIGRVVPCVSRLHVFGDYYHFGVGDSAKVNGARARFEYHLTDSFIITASYSYDNLRHGSTFVGFRASFGGPSTNPNMPMSARMEDFVIRDIDIFVVNNKSQSGRFTDPRKYWFVNNAAPPGGNGTYEHPFNTELQAKSAARNGDVIYTFQGNNVYPLPTGGLNIKPYQFFTASGGPLIFRGVTVLPATQPPVLNGRLNANTGNTISNFILSGSRTSENIGIFGNGLQNVTLSNLTVQDFSGASSLSYYYQRAVGGNATGIQFTNSSNVNLTSVIVSNISGGSANGASSSGINTIVVGEDGGHGGNGIGIDLSGSNSTLTRVVISGIRGGSANGGDAVLQNSGIQYFVLGGKGGYGGRAGAILQNGRGNIKLTDVTINNIRGGSANGGTATGVGTGISLAQGGDGGSQSLSGDAFGIEIANSPSASLSNVSISGISGGSKNGGDSFATGNVSDRSYGGNGGSGSDNSRALGVNISHSTANLSNINISNLIGGSANGGEGVIGSGLFGFGGHGGHGGAAYGINLNSVAVTSFNNITFSQPISGGLALGGFGTTLNGFNGTTGTALNVHIY